MALWIICTPLIIFFNSFAIGKVYKRFNNQLSSYLTTLLGFLTYFGVISLLFIVVMLFTATFKVVLLSLMIYQIILGIIYLFNWRWFFISYNVNIKYLLLLLSLIILSCLAYVLTRNFNADQINWCLAGANDYKSYLVSDYYNAALTFRPTNEIVVFTFGENFLEKKYNFNFIYIIYVVLTYIFDVSLSQMNIFYSYCNILFFSFLISLTGIHLIDTIWYKTEGKSIIAIEILVFTLSIIGYWFDINLWILLMTALLILLHNSKENEVPSAIAVYIINFIVLTGVLFSARFIICAVVINIVQLFISFKSKKENATNYNIMMMFSTLLFTAMIFENKNYLSFILIVILFILYSIYMMFHSSNIAYRVNNKIDEFIYQKINIIIIICTSIIVILSVAIFLSNKDFDIYLDPWTLYDYQSNYNITAIQQFLNVFYWVSNAGLFVYVLLSNNIITFKRKIGQYFPEADFVFLTFLIFWNPVATNLFNSIYNLDIIYLTPNFGVMFYCVCVPILFHLCKKSTEGNKLTLNHYLYYSTAAITTIISIVAINIGA